MKCGLQSVLIQHAKIFMQLIDMHMVRISRIENEKATEDDKKWGLREEDYRLAVDS